MHDAAVVRSLCTLMHAVISAGSGGSHVRRISGKETSWAAPRFLGITQRVPIAVVVALTGEHFGIVMLAFFSVRFCSGNDRRDITYQPSKFRASK